MQELNLIPDENTVLPFKHLSVYIFTDYFWREQGNVHANI